MTVTKTLPNRHESFSLSRASAGQLLEILWEIHRHLELIITRGGPEHEFTSFVNWSKQLTSPADDKQRSRRWISDHEMWKEGFEIDDDLKPTLGDYNGATKIFVLASERVQLNYRPIKDEKKGELKNQRVLRLTLTSTTQVWLEDYEITKIGPNLSRATSSRFTCLQGKFPEAEVLKLQKLIIRELVRPAILGLRDVLESTMTDAWNLAREADLRIRHVDQLLAGIKEIDHYAFSFIRGFGYPR